MSGTEDTSDQVSGKSKQTLLRRHNFFKILTVAGVGIGLLLYAGMTLSQNPDIPATPDRRETMFLGNQNATVNHRIPPIDAAAPVQTETATFALG